MKIRIGKYKGKTVEAVPLSWCEWAVKTLWGGEFHDHAVAAKERLERPDSRIGLHDIDLEAQADALLARAGYTKSGQRRR